MIYTKTLHAAYRRLLHSFHKIRIYIVNHHLPARRRIRDCPPCPLNPHRLPSFMIYNVRSHNLWFTFVGLLEFRISSFLVAVHIRNEPLDIGDGIPRRVVAARAKLRIPTRHGEDGDYLCAQGGF